MTEIALKLNLTYSHQSTKIKFPISDAKQKESVFKNAACCNVKHNLWNWLSIKESWFFWEHYNFGMSTGQVRSVSRLVTFKINRVLAWLWEVKSPAARRARRAVTCSTTTTSSLFAVSRYHRRDSAQFDKSTTAQVAAYLGMQFKMRFS